MDRKIAIIGTGLVGRGWSIVFARAGFQVALFDNHQRTLEQAPNLIELSLNSLVRFKLIESAESVLSRIRIAESLREALEDAEYAQENVFEDLDVKKEIFAAIDANIGSSTLIGSSSSGIPASAFTENVKCRERVLVAHPLNPPYLIPLVELVPAPWTSPLTLRSVHSLMEHVGQVPVDLAREIEGFLVNRLQGVLLMEAWRLVEEGCASVEDLDRTMKHGLGLRWSFMGPFETIDLNAPAGIADYARRFGSLYHRIASSRAEHQVWPAVLISEVERQRRSVLAASDLTARMAWRDRRLMALALHRRDQEEESREQVNGG